MDQQVLVGLFKPAQLRAARRSLGWSERDIAEAVGVTWDIVVGWEEARAVPSPDQFQALASALEVPDRYLLTEAPEEPGRPFFRRTAEPEPVSMSPATRRSVHLFYDLCRRQNELSGLLGRSRPEMPFYEISDPEALAAKMRDDRGLGREPIPDVDALLQKLGVKIFRLDVPGGEFAGLSIRDESFGPAVMLNATDAAYRQRFTLCHELGHLVVTRSSARQVTACDLDWTGGAERAANLFSGAFLMPPDAPELHAFHAEQPDAGPQELDPLCGIFGVGREVVARRLVELEMYEHGLIGEVVRARLPEPRRSDIRRRSPNWRRRLGRPYVQLAKQAHARRLISMGRLAEYLDVDPETALDFVAGPAAR